MINISFKKGSIFHIEVKVVKYKNKGMTYLLIHTKFGYVMDPKL